MVTSRVFEAIVLPGVTAKLFSVITVVAAGAAVVPSIVHRAALGVVRAAVGKFASLRGVARFPGLESFD